MKVKVKVAEAEDSDLYNLVAVASEGFKRNEPLWDASWPNHWTESGRQEASERWKRIKHSDPTVHYLKAVDESTGQIVGMAKWNIYENCIPDFSTIDGGKNDKLDPEETEYMGALIEDFLIERLAAIHRTNGNVASLDVLAVHPQHQRQGVGDELVKWGTKVADKLGMEAVVESSVFGKGLYEKNGFEYVKDVWVKVPERWKDRPVQQFAWLVRPKKS